MKEIGFIEKFKGKFFNLNFNNFLFFKLYRLNIICVYRMYQHLIVSDMFICSYFTFS